MNVNKKEVLLWGAYSQRKKRLHATEYPFGNSVRLFYEEYSFVHENELILFLAQTIWKNSDKIYFLKVTFDI